jgi:hypothetical protein
LLGTISWAHTLCSQTQWRYLPSFFGAHFDIIIGYSPAGYSAKCVDHAWWCPPAHFICAARNYLETIYTGRWIGRQGPLSWPSRSPYRNPLDLLRGQIELFGVSFSGSYWRGTASSRSKRTSVRKTPGILQRVSEPMHRRAEICVLQWKANILGICCNPNNNCCILWMQRKTTFCCCVSSWTELSFLLITIFWLVFNSRCTVLWH